MDQKKKKINVKIIVSIVAVVIIAIVGIVIFTSNKGTPEETKQESKIPEVTYNIGDTVSTDIAQFTLNDSQLTIALSNVIDENYGLPKEYDAQRDVQNPYVAKVGHTLVYLEYTITNTNRSGSMDIQTSIANMQYNDKIYSTVYDTNSSSYTGRLTAIKMEIATSYGTVATNKWKRIETTNSLLSTQEKASYRQYIDISENIENINDKYYINIKLPTSEGQEQNFTYIVPIKK